MAWWRTMGGYSFHNRLDIKGIMDLDTLTKAFLRIQWTARSPQARARLGFCAASLGQRWPDGRPKEVMRSITYPKLKELWTWILDDLLVDIAECQDSAGHSLLSVLWCLPCPEMAWWPLWEGICGSGLAVARTPQDLGLRKVGSVIGDQHYRVVYITKKPQQTQG